MLVFTNAEKWSLSVLYSEFAEYIAPEERHTLAWAASKAQWGIHISKAHLIRVPLHQWHCQHWWEFVRHDKNQILGNTYAYIFELCDQKD